MAAIMYHWSRVSGGLVLQTPFPLGPYAFFLFVVENAYSVPHPSTYMYLYTGRDEVDKVACSDDVCACKWLNFGPDPTI